MYALCSKDNAKFCCQDCIIKSPISAEQEVRSLADVKKEFEDTTRKLEKDTVHGPMQRIHASLAAVAEAVSKDYNYQTWQKMAT